MPWTINSQLDEFQVKNGDEQLIISDVGHSMCIEYQITTKEMVCKSGFVR